MVQLSVNPRSPPRKKRRRSNHRPVLPGRRWHLRLDLICTVLLEPLDLVNLGFCEARYVMTLVHKWALVPGSPRLRLAQAAYRGRG